jgi:hypothetical protein
MISLVPKSNITFDSAADSAAAVAAAAAAAAVSTNQVSAAR